MAALVPMNAPFTAPFNQLRAAVNKPIDLNLLQQKAGATAAAPVAPFENKKMGVTFFPPVNMVYPPNGKRVLKKSGFYSAIKVTAELSEDEFDWSNPKHVAARFNNDGKRMPVILEPGSQSDCGSCWAWSSVDVLSDRWAIANRVKAFRLSTIELCACGNLGYPCCDGGDPHVAGKFLENRGVTSDECVPYNQFCPEGSVGCTNPECSGLVSDQTRCFDDSTKRSVWKAVNGTNVITTFKDFVDYSESSRNSKTEHAIMTRAKIEANIKNIKNDVWKYGPCVTSFHTMAGVMQPQTWTDGIYRPDLNDTWLGGHAVCLVGWGIQNGVRYWKIRNSWSKSWGDGGYGKMIMSNQGSPSVGFDTAVSYPSNITGYAMDVVLGACYSFQSDKTSGIKIDEIREDEDEVEGFESFTDDNGGTNANGDGEILPVEEEEVVTEDVVVNRKNQTTSRIVIAIIVILITVILLQIRRSA